jgi:SM-20-related protein
MQFATPHLVIDDFLPAAEAQTLLDSIIRGAERFTPAMIRRSGDDQLIPDIRSSLRLPGRIGVELEPFREAVLAAFDKICKGTGVSPFPVYRTECSIVSHGDGDYYRTHIDTRTGDEEPGGQQAGDYRLISCVYYLNRVPARFSGGELSLHSLRGGESTNIAPRHNRLVAFPSFIPHEVLPIACPEGTFADSRFSINCWLRRERAPTS